MTPTGFHDVPGWQARSLRAVFVAPAVASLAAAAAVFIVVGGWRPMVWQSFVISLLASTTISVCAGLLLPPVIRPITRAMRLPLTAGITATLLIAAAIGTFIAAFLAIQLGLLPMSMRSWSSYVQMLRVTAALALVSGFGGLFYQRLTTELRQTRAQLHERELLHERATKQALEARLSSLESRVQPHFLFNTLNSVAALIPVDPGRAEQVIGRLASLLRTSLGRAGLRTITLDDELAIVRDYLAIEQERLGDRLTWAITTGAATESCRVPPFAVQSLVENAVKYGIGSQDAGGRIAITSTRDADGLHVEVRDTGPGFDLTAVPAGHGLDNTVSRLETTFGADAGVATRRGPGWCAVTLHAPVHLEDTGSP